MRAIDTNVIVRLVAADDAAQRKRALALLDERFIILPTVILETVWVLQAIYGKKRGEIASKLAELLGHENAVLVSGEALFWALQRYAVQGDFADFLHIALASDADAKCFSTFDRALAKCHDALVAIEQLT